MSPRPPMPTAASRSPRCSRSPSRTSTASPRTTATTRRRTEGAPGAAGLSCSRRHIHSFGVYKNGAAKVWYLRGGACIAMFGNQGHLNEVSPDSLSLPARGRPRDAPRRRGVVSRRRRRRRRGDLLPLQAVPHLAPLADEVLVQRAHLRRDQAVVLRERLLQDVHLGTKGRRKGLQCPLDC